MNDSVIVVGLFIVYDAKTGHDSHVIFIMLIVSPTTLPINVLFLWYF